MPSPHLLMELDARNNAGKKVVQLENQVHKLTKQLKALGVTTKKQERTNQRLRRSFDQMRKSTQRARRGFSKVKTAAVGLGAVFAGGIMIDGIKDAASFQAKLGSLGPNIDETRARLEELQRLTGHTFSIDALARAESMIKAFGLQDELKLTPKLLEVITSKAAKMGITTDHAINSMIVALARGSSKWLDNLGIIVKASGANEAYKRSIGDVNKKLTDQEKQIAFVRAALREMDKDTGEVSESYKTAAQMTAKLDDAIIGLKEALLPLAPMLVNAIEGFAKVTVGIGHMTNALLEAAGLADTILEKRIKATGAEQITSRKIAERAVLEAELHKRGIANIQEFQALNERVQKHIRLKANEGFEGSVKRALAMRFMTQENRRRIVSDLGREARDRQVLHEKKLVHIQEERDARAAAESWFGMQVPGKPKKKKLPKVRSTRPTRAERAIDLEILDLQLLKEQSVADVEKMHIQHQIEQLELQKLRVDRQRDEKGVLDARQLILDARHSSEITAAETKAKLDADEAARDKLKEENKKAQHVIALQIADVETKLASTRDEEAQIQLQRQIEDLELQKERIGATKEEIELIEKKIAALKAGRSVEDQEREASAWHTFAKGIDASGSALQSFSPGMGAMIAQMAEFADVMGEQKSTTADITKATIKGVGLTAAAFVEGEREKAAILSAMEFAQAIASWANPAAAVAHTIAGGMFAAVAAKAGGGAGKKPTAKPRAGGGGGGGITVNFGTGIVLGSPQDVGRAVYQATGAVDKTGMQSGAV